MEKNEEEELKQNVTRKRSYSDHNMVIATLEIHQKMPKWHFLVFKKLSKIVNICYN